ncbi:MAG: hypothetical protein LUF82_06610, partial [Clostridia bacterium]|nr:hypothetical protein [Clostridia bacterium]
NIASAAQPAGRQSWRDCHAVEPARNDVKFSVVYNAVKILLEPKGGALQKNKQRAADVKSAVRRFLTFPYAHIRNSLFMLTK